MKQRPPRGIDEGLVGCFVCGKVTAVEETHCRRCQSRIHIRKPNSLQRTVALMIAAAVFYVPANLLPIMTITEFGDATPTTIMAGLISFWQAGSYPIALVIFTASILIPLLKIVALTWLCAAASGKLRPSPKNLSKIYLITELLGRWSMIDLFVVGILVALVQLGSYMTIVPEMGAAAFGAVVILTMLAANSFDPRLLWDRLDGSNSRTSHPEPSRETN